MNTIEKALAKKQKAKQNIETESIENAEPSNEQILVADTNIQGGFPQTKEEQNSTVQSQTTDIVIDGEQLIERGYMFGPGSRRTTQEEFRQIKRKLLYNAFGLASKTLNNSNLIMVSSSSPNEGKTFVSINLALSMALEQDKTVLLVDADVLRPSINRELNFSSRRGLVDYLLSEVGEVSDIIQSTNIENLKIISSGKTHDLTNELLASNRMEQLAQELAERYSDRIVIFDCPPILGVTETPVLSHLVGQALIVVEESKTKVENVKKAASLLNEDVALGVVINKTLKSAQETYGYYRYGYGAKE